MLSIAIPKGNVIALIEQPLVSLIQAKDLAISIANPMEVSIITKESNA